MKEKSEKLFDAIGNISDDLLEEAYSDENYEIPQIRKTKIIRWVAAACISCVVIVLSISLLFPLLNIKNKKNYTKSANATYETIKGKTENDSNNGGLVITAMAMEPVKLQPKETVKLKADSSDYTLLMSSTPGMPFVFQYELNNKDVEIEVSANEGGKIQQWTVDDEGMWHCEKEGEEITITSGEQIIWKGGEGKIIAKVFVEGECVEIKTISIVSYDDMYYTAVLEE